MALEPITRKEKIIAGQDLTPITRMEKFLKQYGGGGGGGSVPTTGGVTTLHINVTALNSETLDATFAADKTPAEMTQASANGPIWCVITFAAGIVAEEAFSAGLPPAWYYGVAFGMALQNDQGGNNKISCIVARETPDTWKLDLEAFIAG